MQLRIEKSALTEAMKGAAWALPARPPVPVLAGLKLTADQGGLTVAAYDYEVSTNLTVPAEVADHGQVLVSGRLLSDITKTLPNKPVDISLDGTRLSMTAGAARFQLQTMPLEEYPALPDTPPKIGTLSGVALRDAVARVAPATSRDDTIPALTGIQLSADAEHLTLAATDRYRFAVGRLPWKPTVKDPAVRALVPAQTLLDAAKVMADEEEVTVQLSDGILGLHTPRQAITTRLLDGELPAYSKLFPTEFAATVTTKTAALSEAVGRVALVAARNTPVRLEITDGRIRLSAGTSDDATGDDQVNAELEGEPMTINLNPGFLQEALKALDHNTTKLNLVTATKPTLLHAPDRADDFKTLVMPVRVTS